MIFVETHLKKASTILAVCLTSFVTVPVQSDTFVYIDDVPDYAWYYGCFGTGSGNLAGYWDRNGFPEFYDGPTNSGVAPLNTNGSNSGIISLWASRAGFDGRPADKPGHVDDYYITYEGTGVDPYITLGRPEHSPDSIGDFIGLSQKKWTDLNGECDGNIDAFSFVFWEKTGLRRTNFTPQDSLENPVRDIQSGLRNWTRFRGYEADVFTQLTDFNHTVPVGNGFTFEDMKAEIDAGYPVLLYMQDFDQTSRSLSKPTSMPEANPNIHGMIAVGYFIRDNGEARVIFHTSWASGQQLALWNDDNWTPLGQLNLPVRGVIGYHPKPRIRNMEIQSAGIVIDWEGPDSILKSRQNINEPEVSKALHWYVIEKSTSLAPNNFQAVTPPMTAVRQALVKTSPSVEEEAYFRVRLLSPDEVEALGDQVYLNNRN